LHPIPRVPDRATVEALHLVNRGLPAGLMDFDREQGVFVHRISPLGAPEPRVLKWMLASAVDVMGMLDADVNLR